MIRNHDGDSDPNGPNLRKKYPKCKSIMDRWTALNPLWGSRAMEYESKVRTTVDIYIEHGVDEQFNEWQHSPNEVKHLYEQQYPMLGQLLQCVADNYGKGE
jgi:hypothetical protein